MLVDSDQKLQDGTESGTPVLQHLGGAGSRAPPPLSPAPRLPSIISHSGVRSEEHVLIAAGVEVVRVEGRG